MRHLIPLAPDHSEILATRRPAILDGIATETGTGDHLPAVLESLRGFLVAALCLLVWLGCSAAPQPAATTPEEAPAPFIVQGSDLATVIEAIRQVGGDLTHELAVIRAAGVRLTKSQRAAIEAIDGITRVWEDRSVSLQSAGGAPEQTPAPARQHAAN